MSKWISDAYIKRLLQNNRLLQGNCEYKLWEQEVEKTVDAMPSIDIVFCKECRYCLVGVATAQYSNGKQRIENLCEKHKWSVRADDFCSYGERSSE